MLGPSRSLVPSQKSTQHNTERTELRAILASHRLPVSGQRVSLHFSSLISESVAGSGQLKNPVTSLTLAEVGDIVKVLEVVLFLAGEGAALSGRRESRKLSGELHVEVADVFFASDGRDERRRDFSLEKRLPVHTLNDIHALVRTVATLCAIMSMLKTTLTLKKGCFFTSSASFSPEPRRLSGFLLNN